MGVICCAKHTEKKSKIPTIIIFIPKIVRIESPRIAFQDDKYMVNYWKDMDMGVRGTMLAATGIWKSYGRRVILKDIDLEAEPGQCVGIVGANGCGKTTLLSILAGTLKADRGRVVLNGREATGHPAVFAEMAAYVPQENPLMEELSVRDNLLLWYRGSKRDMEADLEAGPAAMLGIPAMLKQRAGTLSGGMKKRLSIACALSNHAPLLILDEPGAALDLECKEDIRHYLKTYMSQGGAVVFTSHEMEELSLCTRICVLRQAGLVPVDRNLSPHELIDQFH